MAQIVYNPCTYNVKISVQVMRAYVHPLMRNTLCAVIVNIVSDRLSDTLYTVLSASIHQSSGIFSFT